jgi:hypothetical protein
MVQLQALPMNLHIKAATSKNGHPHHPAHHVDVYTTHAIHPPFLCAHSVSTVD